MSANVMTAVIDNEARLVSQLISSCYQAQNGYRSAASAVGDERLRKLLEIYAQQRTRFAEELREYLPIEAECGDEEAGKVEERGERDSVRECLDIDSRTVALYKQAVAQRALPTRAHFLISSQLALMERVHDRMNLMLANPPGAKVLGTAPGSQTRLQRVTA